MKCSQSNFILEYSYLCHVEAAKTPVDMKHHIRSEKQEPEEEESLTQLFCLSSAETGQTRS